MKCEYIGKEKCGSSDRYTWRTKTFAIEGMIASFGCRIQYLGKLRVVTLSRGPAITGRSKEIKRSADYRHKQSKTIRIRESTARYSLTSLTTQTMQTTICVNLIVNQELLLVAKWLVFWNEWESFRCGKKRSSHQWCIAAPTALAEVHKNDLKLITQPSAIELWNWRSPKFCLVRFTFRPPDTIILLSLLSCAMYRPWMARTTVHW